MTTNTFTPAQQHRLHFVLDIFDGMDGMDRELIEAGLNFARHGINGQIPNALITLCAEPWEAAAAEGEWEGNAVEQAVHDIERVVAEALAIPLAGSDVLEERRRQVEVEGWSPEHDDLHKHGQLAEAAAAYATATTAKRFEDYRHVVPSLWPWSPKWWKPTSERRMLVKAGALIVAEIERLDRKGAA